MKITKDLRLSFQVETESHGVVLVHSIPVGRIGRPEEESAKVGAFARSVDAAVVGLGT